VFLIGVGFVAFVATVRNREKAQCQMRVPLTLIKCLRATMRIAPFLWRTTSAG
jgi:hypothetical protein